MQVRRQPRRPSTRSIPLTLSTQNLGWVFVARVTWAGGRKILFSLVAGHILKGNRPCCRPSLSLCAGVRRLFPARPPHKFTSTVWANEVHLLGATRAVCAFVAANVCLSTWFKCSSASFTHSF